MPEVDSLPGEGRSVLIIAAKRVASTPRVLKEVKWLTSEGYSVDTLGFGAPPPSVRAHHQLKSINVFTRYISYLIPNWQLRFHLALGRSLRTLQKDLDMERYAVLIVHEPTLFPWRHLQREIARRLGSGVHVDLHENHVDSLSRTIAERVFFEGYRRWEFAQLSASAQAGPEMTYSACSNSIAKIFSEALGSHTIALRNSTEWQNLRPSRTNQDHIRLVHHGVGTRDRGIEGYLRALKSLPPRFDLTLMLVSGPIYMLKIRILIWLFGISSRVCLRKPVPTIDIAKAVNEYDLALMQIPPVTSNERFALPNKFFESVQGRLGIVTGPSPDIEALVRLHDLGIVTSDWSHSSLVVALNSITIEELDTFKRNAGIASIGLSSRDDKVRFLALISKHCEAALD